MSSLAEQLQQALNSHRPLVAVPDVIDFRCGKMKFDTNGTTVQPDLRKGRITVRTADDGCLHFTWTERTSNSAEPEDDLILFPGDATFGRVEAARNNTKNNRVFALKFTATKKVHLFWMQEPNKDKDDELVRKINIKINGEAEAAAPAAANVHQMDQASLLALFEGRQPAQAVPNPSSTNAEAAPSTSTSDNASGDAAMQDTPAAGPAAASEPAAGDKNAPAEAKVDKAEESPAGGQAAGGSEQMDVDPGAGGDKDAPASK